MENKPNLGNPKDCKWRVKIHERQASSERENCQTLAKNKEKKAILRMQLAKQLTLCKGTFYVYLYSLSKFSGKMRKYCPKF